MYIQTDRDIFFSSSSTSYTTTPFSHAVWFEQEFGCQSFDELVAQHLNSVYSIPGAPMVATATVGADNFTAPPLAHAYVVGQ
jgi:hypothetical protein